MKDDKVPDDLLVLSCEDDYAICVPFLEKGYKYFLKLTPYMSCEFRFLLELFAVFMHSGAAVYSSELLLNGIVTQKLDYERLLL